MLLLLFECKRILSADAVEVVSALDVKGCFFEGGFCRDMLSHASRQALAGDILLCSWAKHYILTVPLSTQVYKWVPEKLMLGVTLRLTSIPSRGGVEILQVTLFY